MRRLALLLGLVLLLPACSGLRLIESEVESHAAQAPPAALATGQRYRFERLPSQADVVRAAAIEAMAETALSRVGLVRADGAASLSVQITTRRQPYQVDAWGQPTEGTRFHGSIMIGAGSMGGMFGLGMGMGLPQPTRYRHEVELLLREIASGRLVYETRASHEGPWNDSDKLLPVLFEAALQDFPHPPAGPRRVKIEIPD